MTLEAGSSPDAAGAPVEYYQHLAEEERGILDALPTAIGLVQNHRIVWINRAFVTTFGYSLAEARAMPLSDCFDDATELERVRRESTSVVMGGGTYQTDVVMRRKNGETFWGSARGRLLFPEHSDGGWVWVLTDISERKRVETELRLNEARLLTAQTQAQICSWEQGRDPNDRYWSEQMFPLLGFDPAQSFPSNAAILERFDPRDRETLIAAQHRAADTGKVVRVICRSNTEFGPLRYFEASMAPQFDEAGRFLRQVGTLQDVTERKLNEEALKLGQSRFEIAQAQARIGNWELGPNLEPVYWSKQMFVLFGRDPGLGVPPLDEYLRGVHPDDRTALAEGPRRALESGQPYRCVHRSDPSMGEPRHFEVTMVPELDDRGRPLRMTGTTQDITERILIEHALRLSESRLERAQAQAKIGGWEFNPTTNALFYSKQMYHLLGQDPASGPPGPANWLEGAAPDDRERVSAALRAVAESHHPITLEFRGHEPSRASDRYFETTMAAVRDDSGSLLYIAGTLQDVSERKQAERERSKLQEQLGQALKMEAIGRLAGGVAHDFNNLLTVIVGNVELGLDGLDRREFGVVKQAGGTIETYSELGLGTTFKIYLPRVDVPAQPIENAAKAMEMLHGTETILLVEDNDSLRQLTANMLRRLGYRLFVADGGMSALRLLKADRPSIDLLLTDLVMPGMSGRELSRCVQELFPEVPVLYCSGYTEDTFVRHGLASEKLQFIGKPFTSRQLGQKVRQVLDDARERKHHVDQGAPPGRPV